MKNWKQTLLASASGAVLAGSAYAADMPIKASPPPPPALPVINWTGPYIGGHVGAGGYQSSCGPDGISAFGWNCAGGTGNVIDRDIGFMAGVHAGWDWQDRYFVYGVVGDWTWTNLKTRSTGNSGSVSYHSKVNWLASFRGRAGLALDTTLVYITGGLGVGSFKDSVLQGLTSGNTFHNTLVGWVAGAGIEHRFAFNPNWSWQLEFLHYDFGHNTETLACLDCSATTPGYSHTFTHTVDEGRLGVSYRW